jgi:hypothetical protein
MAMGESIVSTTELLGQDATNSNCRQRVRSADDAEVDERRPICSYMHSAMRTWLRFHGNE